MAVINAQIYQGNERLAEWSQPCDTNLEELLKAIVQTKENLNNYLTDLSAKSKNVTTSNKSVEEDEDCDEALEDPLAEMFKKLSDCRKATSSENSVKRKNNSRNSTKKRRR